MQEVESSWTYVYVVGYTSASRRARVGGIREGGSAGPRRVDRDLERDRGEEAVLRGWVHSDCRKTKGPNHGRGLPTRASASLALL